LTTRFIRRWLTSLIAVLLAAPALTAGILTLLRGGAHDDAARWAEVCSGSGHCIPACAYGINPRLMLALARVATLAAKPQADQRQTGFSRFGAMTKGVRVLSRL
jgi:hypothetical protein